MSQALRSASTADRPPAGLARFEGRRAGRTALVSLVLIVAAVISLYVRAYPKLSPIDELHHVDYMIKAADGQLLRRGDDIGPETRREGACRGVDAPGQPAPECGDEAWLAGREFNTEEIQPPAYYFVTGWLARILRPVLGTSSLVTAGRVVGALWLSAGVLAMWAALAMLRVPLLARWAAAALVATTPVVLHASAVVTNDATSFVAGAAMLAAALAWEKRRLPGFVVVLAVVVGVSFRFTNAFGAVVVILYLGVRALPAAGDHERSSPPPRRALCVMAAAVAASVVVTGLAWLALGSAVARVGPLANPNTFNQQSCCVPFEAVLGQLPAAVTPAHDPYLPPFLQNQVVRTLVSFTDWLLLGAAVGLAVLSARGSRAEALAVSVAVSAVALGPALTVSNYVFQGAFYGIPPRYGLSLMPALAVVLALSLEKLWPRVAVASFAAVSVLVTIVAELK